MFDDMVRKVHNNYLLTFLKSNIIGRILGSWVESKVAGCFVFYKKKTVLPFLAPTGGSNPVGPISNLLLNII